MKKLLALLGAVGIVASTGVSSVVSCGKPDTQNDKLKLNQVDDSTMLINEQKVVNITPVVENAEFANITLKAKISDENVANVKVEGDTLTITALANGDATITVSVEGYSDLNFNVTVNTELSDKEITDAVAEIGKVVNAKAQGSQTASWADEDYISELKSEQAVKDLLEENLNSDNLFYFIKNFKVSTTSDATYDVDGNKTVTVSFEFKDHYSYSGPKKTTKVINKAYNTEK